MRKHLGISEQGKDKLKSARLEFGLVGVACLALITGTWMSFTQGYDTVMSFNVPIEYTNRPANLEIMETSSSIIRVEVVGAAPVIKSIRPERLSVRIDLSNCVPGKNVFTITKQNIELPPGALLSKVNPQFVNVYLDELEERLLPVQVDWTGTIPREVVVTQIDLEPSKVKVIGGKRALEGIETIYTEKVQADGISGDATITARLALYPPSLRLGTGEKERVTINLKVIRRDEWKDLVDRGGIR
jgi:YbbR domain-containing protein